jgi:hypothetical protein
MVQRILANKLIRCHRHNVGRVDKRRLGGVAVLRPSRPMNKTSKMVGRRRKSKRPVPSYRVESPVNRPLPGTRRAVLFSFTNVERAHLGCRQL